MKLRFDIKTISEANNRDHWATKMIRKNSQQNAFRALWRNSKAKVNLPAVIIFTRYSCKVLDDDNLRSAFKAIRDQLAKEIGVDDGSQLITFAYCQEKINKRQHYFEIEIREV